MLQTVQNNNLNEAATEGVAVVDFSATWCGPCKMLAPVFHTLAQEMGEDTTFCTVDVDQNMQLAQQFRVSAEPTVVILKNGKEVARSMGFQPKERLKAWIESNQ